MTINEHKIFRFDNAQDIHMNSINYDKKGYGFDVDVITILFESLVVCPRRSEAMFGKNRQLVTNELVEFDV